MADFTLYFLADKTNLFATYATNKNLVIGARDVKQIYKLRSLLLNHRLKYGRWINRYMNRSFDDDYHSNITITTNTSHTSCRYLSVLPMNFNDEDQLHENAFIFRHSDVFIADEFDYDRVSDVLSLQGISISTDNIFDKNDYEDVCSYLDSCLKN